MKILFLAFTAFGVFNSVAHASTPLEAMIGNIETTHQIKCNFIKTSPRLSSIKDVYECKNQQGEAKAMIKIISEAHNSGQFFEIGKIKHFEVTFKH